MVREREIDGTIKPSVPYIELGGADCLNIIIADYNPMAWFKTYFCTSDFEYKENSIEGSIYVYTTGIYLIDYLIDFACSNAGATVELIVKINGTEISGGHCLQYVKYYSHVILTKMIYLKAGDIVTFGFWANSDDTDIAFADYSGEGEEVYSHFRLSYIPMGGWNNNTGGNIIDRGVKR
jgi:hypothetical protein